MDTFFPEKLLGEFFWDHETQTNFVQNPNIISETKPCPPTNPSAFVQYRDQPRKSFLQVSNSQIMNKRMLEFMRKSLPLERNKVAEYERERGFKHMISERMRRQRQRQCCVNLHSVLPQGTKKDSNSVVQTAAMEIQRLQGCRDELQRRNVVLEGKLEAVESNKIGGRKIEYLKVPYQKCGIDPIVETLKCLKGLGVDTKSIKSNLSQQELFAVLEIETEIAGTDVERATQRTLDEIVWKLGSHVPEGSTNNLGKGL